MYDTHLSYVSCIFAYFPLMTRPPVALLSHDRRSFFFYVRFSRISITDITNHSQAENHCF